MIKMNRMREATDFAGTSSEVEALAPPEVQVKRVVLGQHLNTTRAALLRHLNSGQLVVTYLGHGSEEVWAGEGLLTADDVRGLHYVPRLPVVVTLNCRNGFFHDVYTESLAEAWLKAPHGGAIAVWASWGLTAAHAHRTSTRPTPEVDSVRRSDSADLAMGCLSTL